jgi:hypothetical protein
MKCLKRAEKATAIAAARLANEKMELEILTSAMIFTEVAHKTGLIDAKTRATVQSEIIGDFRKKRKLEMPTTGGPRTTVQLFASGLIKALAGETRYASAASLYQAYRASSSCAACESEKEFMRLFLAEVECPRQKFARKAHRPDLYELKAADMRAKLERRGGYEESHCALHCVFEAV